jgi:hypothetical protein
MVEVRLRAAAVKKQSVTWESNPLKVEKNIRCHLVAGRYPDFQFQDTSKILSVL